jgi:hypothetical protein
MVLSATQSIPADAPLLLSYFEGGNDEFLLHYGAYRVCKLPVTTHDVVFSGQAAGLAADSCCYCSMPVHCATSDAVCGALKVLLHLLNMLAAAPDSEC